MNAHRKYNFLRNELEQFLLSFINKLSLGDTRDKAIYDKIYEAIELADNIASREKDTYDSND